LSVLLRYTDSD